jgi:hypothetical protein
MSIFVVSWWSSTQWMERGQTFKAVLKRYGERFRHTHLIPRAHNALSKPSKSVAGAKSGHPCSAFGSLLEIESCFTVLVRVDSPLC